MTPEKHIEPLLRQIQTPEPSKPVKTTPAAQERPKTALVELAEYCEQQAATHQRLLHSGNGVWRVEHQELYDQYTRWATACREADGE